MKYIIVLLMFPLFLSAQADYDSVESSKWLVDYDTAITKAKKEKKNVLLFFTGSDWCPPCKVLKKDLFESDEFKEVSEAYVLLYIDIPRNRDLLSSTQMTHNKELMAKLNKKGTFPLLKVLSNKGKELDEISGYSMNGVIDYHMKLLKKYKG